MEMESKLYKKGELNAIWRLGSLEIETENENRMKFDIEKSHFWKWTRNQCFSNPRNSTISTGHFLFFFFPFAVVVKKSFFVIYSYITHLQPYSAIRRGEYFLIFHKTVFIRIESFYTSRIWIEYNDSIRMNSKIQFCENQNIFPATDCRIGLLFKIF